MTRSQPSRGVKKNDPPPSTPREPHMGRLQEERGKGRPHTTLGAHSGLYTEACTGFSCQGHTPYFPPTISSAAPASSGHLSRPGIELGKQAVPAWLSAG